MGKELGGEYYEKAAPVIERQVARAGYRMAAWLDKIAEKYAANGGSVLPGTEQDLDDLLPEEL